MGLSYKTAGVDIEAGDETVKRIKPLVRSTFNDKVLADIGLFGGFYDAKFEEYQHPILVASTDGVGTKLKIAFLMDKHDTVGQDLVNHCVNDILACGAKPLFFLDYFATGKLEPGIAEQVIGGFVTACRENSAALIGGETAEMPSMYQEGEYDISGTIIGVVEKSKIVDGKKIKPGDVLIGLPSTGLHTNGYSLARAVILKDYRLDSLIDELECTIGEALLKIHKSYLGAVHPLIQDGLIKGISHITGGGIIGNTKRILPKGAEIKIDWSSWKTPLLFDIIKRTGGIDEDEMRNVFNLGIGMILVANTKDCDLIMEKTSGLNPVVIGKVI